MQSVESNVLAFEAALELVKLHAEQLAAPSRTEVLSLLQARGRVLSQPIPADRDQPFFDRSTRDGFAVIAGEFTESARLEIQGTVRAGTTWPGGPLVPGQAIEIMTGAPVPEGADAVAMVEHVVRSGSSICARVGRSLGSGDNIVRRGSEAQRGQTVLDRGTSMHAAEIALAAACGHPSVQVHARPRIAIVSTGDELVELNATPGPQQIRNSNSYALAALIEAAGGEAVRLPIAADERSAVAKSLQAARECDLLVLSGGVSMGEYDLVEEMLLAAGADFFFTGVKMQPGKPAVFGRLREGGQFFFGLPGNPIAVQVTFGCFVEPFLRALAGAPVSGPRRVQATLAEAVSGKPGLTRLLPCRMDAVGSGIEARLVVWQGSGDLPANARANCYAELLPGIEYRAGDVIRVLLRDA